MKYTKDKDDKIEFPKTTHYLFDTVAARLKQRKEELKLTNEEVAGWKLGREIIQEEWKDPTGLEDDESEISKKVVLKKSQFRPEMVSRILNANTKALRHRNSPNPFLFPTAKKGKKGYLEQMKESLKFDSTSEIMWGKHEGFEYSEFYYGLFCALIDDLKKTDYFSSIQDCLKDYIPYSKFLAYSEVTNTSIPFEYLFGYSKDELEFHLRDEGTVAVFRLFDFLDYKFREIFQGFIASPIKIKDHQDWVFKYIEKYLEEFVMKYFIPLIEENAPDATSLGLRVYNIVKDDVSQTDFVESALMSRSSESYGHWLTAGEKNDTDVASELISASEDYIDKLEQLETDIYGNYKQMYRESHPTNLLMEDKINLENEFYEMQEKELQDELELRQSVEKQEEQEIEYLMEQVAEQGGLMEELENHLNQDENSKKHGSN